MSSREQPSLLFKTALNKTSERMMTLAGIWQTDGCNGHQSFHLSDHDICRCVGDRRGGLCFRIGRRRRLATPPDANPDGDIDHCLRSRRAGYFGLEITARVAMASALAVLVRCGLWCPFGRCGPRLGPA